MEEIKKPVIRFEYTCLRCGHKFVRKDSETDPQTCASTTCRSPYWNVPRKEKVVGK